MARLRLLLSLAALSSVQLVGAQLDDVYDEETPLYGGFGSGFDDDPCPDYTSYASYPQ
jgi:hypothetical protein